MIKVLSEIHSFEIKYVLFEITCKCCGRGKQLIINKKKEIEIKVNQ